MPSPIDPSEAREAGAETVGRLRRTAAGRLAMLLQRDPQLMARAVELGLVRREWLERPGEERISDARPVEVLERWLERSVEQRPSALTALGLSTVQVLAGTADERSRDGVPGELAIVFTDLEGFSAFTARNGDEESCRLLAEHKRTVGPIVRGRGGRSVKQLGDGLLLTFPSSHAAVLAALELLDAPPPPLRMRAGVHAGPVLVLPDHDVIGHVVNVAARVTEAARGGEVLVTETVRDETRDLPSVRFGRLRRHAVKGSDPVRCCTVERA